MNSLLRPYSFRKAPAQYDPGFFNQEHENVQKATDSLVRNTDTLNLQDWGFIDPRGRIDAVSAFNGTVKEARKTGATVVIPGTGKYRFQSPANMTFPAGTDATTHRPITIRGEGGMGLGPSSDVSSGQIIADHSGAVFDGIGAYDDIWERINVQATAANPECCWKLGRNSANSSAGTMRFLFPTAYGPFRHGVVYSYASEVNTFIAPHFVNTYEGSSPVWCFTKNNIRGLGSTFSDIATGAQSNTAASIFGGQLHANNPGGDVFLLEGMEELNIDGTFMYAGSGAANGHAIFNVDTSLATTDEIWIKNLRCENGTFLQEYIVRFGDTARTCTGWSLRDLRVASNTRLLSAHDNVTLDNLTIDNVTEMGTPRGFTAKTTTNCTLRTGNMLVNISGTSTNDLVDGISTQWSGAGFAGGRSNGIRINRNLGTVT